VKERRAVPVDTAMSVSLSNPYLLNILALISNLHRSQMSVAVLRLIVRTAKEVVVFIAVLVSSHIMD